MGVPGYAHSLSQFEVNYLCNLRDDKDYNIHLLRESRLLVMRNCSQDGNLSDLKLPKHKYVSEKPWVLLNIKDFKDKSRTYEIPVCCTCTPELAQISSYQCYESIVPLLCHHSRVAGQSWSFMVFGVIHHP